MCGIIGVLGTGEAAPRIMAGLKRLEYRGYDSAGVATVNGGRLDRRRAPGKPDPKKATKSVQNRKNIKKQSETKGFQPRLPKKGDQGRPAAKGQQKRLKCYLGVNESLTLESAY